ncbi:MAG: NusA-like transcription termination signal-binding factor [Thermoprotei archaeon]|nr:MAG: NusA-like transcription termination signal-binding factor [Thermoprotei archaeon]
MPNIRLTEEELRYIALFENITGVPARDCVIDRANDRIIFIVDKGFAGLAVGKGGVNIRRIRELIGKSVEVVEYGETPEELIKNCLYPAKVLAVKITKTANGRKVAVATVAPQEKAIAIGKGGKNINRARILAKRYFDIDWVTIA